MISICAIFYLLTLLRPASRPTISESLKAACPTRDIHVWQMQDPAAVAALDGIGVEEVEWLNLPTLMHHFADKGFAKYQLDLHEAKTNHDAGNLSDAKYQKVVDDCQKIMVLMHTTGQPATQKYVHSHVVLSEGGLMKLSPGAKATLIVFDFKRAKVQVGAYPWVDLRVLKAKVGFQGMELQLDSDFLKTNALTNLMDEYANASQETPEVGENDEGEDALAAMGMMVPFDVEPPGELEKMVEDLMDEMPEDGVAEEVEEAEPFSMVQVFDEEENEDMKLDDAQVISIHFDSDGNLCAGQHDLEIVDSKMAPEELSGHSDKDEKKTVQYIHSPAWRYLRDRGLADTPSVKGCGLCFNRLRGITWYILLHFFLFLPFLLVVGSSISWFSICRIFHFLFPIWSSPLRFGQWIGLYPDYPNIGRSFKVGLRSEHKALLMVLVKL